MIFATAHGLCVAVFVLSLGFALVSDIQRFEVPNWVSGAVLLSFVIAAILRGELVGIIGNNVPMGGAVLVIGGRKTALHGKVGHGTNNEAEYEGLILGLEAALSAGATTVTVHGDSQLVIRQLEGRYAVKASNLQPLFGKAKRMPFSLRVF